LGPVF